MIRNRSFTAYSWKKSYANNRKWLLEFDVSDQVYLKISPVKGVMRFGRKGKLSTRYVWPYKILQYVSEVTYKCVLASELASVHPVFNVFMLMEFLGDPTLILPIKELGVEKDWCYEEVPVEI